MSDAERLLSISPLRAVLRLAIPTSTVMVLGAASGVLHTYFVSRLGAEAIAAVSLVFPINLILMTLAGGGVGAGVSAAIAQALGARRAEAADSAASHAFWITLSFALVFTPSLLLGAPRIFRWMGGEGAVLDGAILFARVLFGGSVVTFTISALDAILRGEGNVRVPSIWATISLSLQIAFTPLFMFGLGFGLGGAAAATISGQLIGVLPRGYFVFSGRAASRPRLWPVRLSAETIAAILRVGVPASLSTLANYLGLMLLTSIVARYGKHEIAAFGLGTRLDFLVIMLAFGGGSAVLTLVGLASGAGDGARIAKVVNSGATLVVTALSGVALLLVWRPALWLGIFSTDAEILEVGSLYLRALAPSYPLTGASMIFAFAFQGIGRGVYPLALVVARTTLVVGGSVLASFWGAPVSAIFVLMSVGNVASSWLLAWQFRRVVRAGARPVPVSPMWGEG